MSDRYDRRKRLFQMCEFILNEADFSELEAIQEALRRRNSSQSLGRPMGISPKRMAMDTASSIQEEVGYSMNSIHEMVKEFARDIIKKNAPELGDRQVDEMLDSWVPQPGSKPAEEPPAMDRDALLTMIRQFLAFSTGTMSVDEQAALHAEMPEWQQRYWERFPKRIRAILTLFLKDQIGEDDCERLLAQELDT